MIRYTIIGIFLFIASFAEAKINSYRWTQQLGLSDDLHAILTQLNRESSLTLKYTDFNLMERKDLSNYRFSTYAQTFQGIPVKGALIRTWVNTQTGHLTQMEAHLEDMQTITLRMAALQKNKFSLQSIRSTEGRTIELAKNIVAKSRDDKRIGQITWVDQWNGNDLERVVTIKGQRGTHKVVISLMTQLLKSHLYKEFPQADIKALVYPIYEESEKEHKLQERVEVILNNVSPYRKSSVADPYLPLQSRRYYENKIDPTRAETPQGQMDGYWSFNWLMKIAKGLYESLGWTANTYETGTYLVGKYATINLHPDAAKLSGIKFPLTYSGQVNYIWRPTKVDGQEVYEVVPLGSYLGRAMTNENDAYNRVARRLADHNPVEYINDGFDEVQVYYAINTLMDSLHGMGFTDPELSTRPFHAFLYDPDISMRDNAYYQNDTINFTTYSPEAQNFARDNSTIWHELGHGVMDRLMGDMITLADSGGLSEGMADFVAQMVIQDVTKGKPFDGSNDFRIINRTSFNMTNESHDDGEAYGGAMKDIMDAAIAQFGPSGLVKITDLTLDAMRLTRNHPALTANDWFEHMLFADELGAAGVRKPGELKNAILSSLKSRNYRLDRGPVAEFNIVANDNLILTSDSPASRYKPLTYELTANQTVTNKLNISVKGSEQFQYKYPVTVSIEYNTGALQGAVNWKNEDAGPTVFTINNEAEMVNFDLTTEPGCDFINREDNSCSDYAYVKIFNNGETRPVAKKRFYVRVYNIQ